MRREEDVVDKHAGDHAQSSIGTKEECTHPSALLLRAETNDNG